MIKRLWWLFDRGAMLALLIVALVLVTSPAFAASPMPGSSGTPSNLSANSLKVAAGTAPAPSVAAKTDTNTGLYWCAADKLCIATGGVEHFNLTTTTGTLTGNLVVTGSITGASFVGLGTMSTQDASNVAITGGTINNTTIGATTATTGAFTTLTATNVRPTSTTLTLQKSGGTETLATFAADGAATLYYDNASKLATTTNGLAITGKATAQVFGGSATNQTTEFSGGSSGASSDGAILELHGSTASGPNQAYLSTSYLEIRKADLSETIAKFDDDAAVTLYFDNSAKLATSSAGGTLTGTWNATTGLQVNGVDVLTTASTYGQRAFLYRFDTTGGTCTEILDPNSWSCSYNGVGDVTITHNFGTTSYGCVGAGSADTRVLYTPTINSNTVQVIIKNLSAGVVNDAVVLVCYK